ncbi:uncharacterized protein LOC107474693 [Arachis duranensis]|uniref:Uncharacterized protein LOC107474693 n=1 Tax=Arachis duranensis TaxID=130453 RepID=A0A6P4CEZ2_ARADU|nr:uncharacterized protein LOC107474693 [Arachis duranensis]
MRTVCKGEECGWVLYASLDSEGNCWQIKTFMDDHTCPRETKNRLANKKWLGCKLVRKLRKYPNLRHCVAAQYFKSKCDLDLNKSSLTRALGDARAIVYGDAAAQYGMVRDYGLTLLKTNPGSTVSIGVTPHPNPDKDPTFDRMYICLDGFKRGFKAGCRPLIGLDGAFLKTKHGGQILSVIGQDVNNHIYVIAYAIVSIENTENWRWFLELLHQDLGDYKQHGWCFISEMQKGLIHAIQDVFPNVHHKFCVWHLWRNFNKQWKDNQLRGLLWECARSTTQEGFVEGMKKLEKLNKDAWTYLCKWPKNSWSRAFFSIAPKMDNICNNACEVFNSRIKDPRAKPIITLLEEVRMYIMRSIARNKVKLRNNDGILPPIQRNYEIFEVHGWPTNMAVDLGKRSCTCDFWQLSGIPCVHACAALARAGRRPDEFCHSWLTMEAYNNTYGFHINPIPSQALWEKSPYNRPQAPKLKKKPEPIKKKRRKDADEEPSKGKKQKTSVKRVHKKGYCRYCGESGHTKRNCHKRVVDEESAAVAAAAATANSDANGGEVNNSAPTAVVNGGDAPAVTQDQVEIQLDLSQPIMSETDDSQQVQPPPVRPSKLPPKRKLSTPTATTQPTSTPSASTPSPPSASTPSASTLPTSS